MHFDRLRSSSCHQIENQLQTVEIIRFREHAHFISWDIWTCLVALMFFISVCSTVRLSVRLPAACLPVRLAVCLPVCPLCLSLSLCLSVPVLCSCFWFLYVSDWLSVCLSLSLSLSRLCLFLFCLRHRHRRCHCCCKRGRRLTRSVIKFKNNSLNRDYSSSRVYGRTNEGTDG